MISSTPLPRFGDIIDGRHGADATPHFRVGNELAFQYSRSAWAMAAVCMAVAEGRGIPAPVFWLPDYFCNQSSEPVRRFGAEVRFYPITEQLEPDWPRCRDLAQGEKPDVFVLVHFYGKPANGAAARSFCDEVGARLLEDAAHVLRPMAGIGTWGDATCYSPHKLLAIPDGSVLTVPAQDLAQIIGRTPVGEVARVGTWMLRRLVQMVAPASVLRRRIAATFPELAADPVYAPLPDTPWPSSLGRQLLAGEMARADDIATARIENRAVLRDLVRARWHASPLIEDETLPLYRDPWVFGDAEVAGDVYRKLRNNGLPVEGWPDLPPEVAALPDQHDVAIRLRHNVITFPVHQTITPDDLRSLL